MHEWGDEWFKKNGVDLNDAINYCTKFWRRWGRIGTHGKEKYGTFRDHTYMWNGRIHGLLYPGYLYIKHKWLYYTFDEYITLPIVTKIGILKLVHWYQSKVYNYAIQKMCKKYPNIIDELVSDLDNYEMIKPGRFGDVDGVVIFNKYWKTLE